MGLIGIVFSALLSLSLNFRAAKYRRHVSTAIAVLSLILLIVFSSLAIYRNETLSFINYSIAPMLSISFFIDRLSAFFILTISIVALGVSIYSLGYVEHYRSEQKKNNLLSLMFAYIASMLLIVASRNMFSFLFFWELMTLSSFLLVMFDYTKKETRKAGLFYFIMTQLSTVFLFVGFFTLYHASGSLDMQKIPSIDSASAGLAFIFLFLGFGTKAGVIPFHKWLPYAHPASPSNISALMSGIMIKVAIYGLMRFVIFVIPPALWWGLLIFGAGAISAVLGVIYALKEHDIKRLLAYHSIENIGIILIGFGLYVIFSFYGQAELAMLGLIGALFHTMNHALFKSLLFLTSGSIINSTETKNIEEMGGLIRKMPYTAMFFFVGAISISALPPFNGFVSEFMIFQSLLMSHSIMSPVIEILLIVGLAAFALTSALAAACFVKAFGITFLAAPRTEEAKNAKEVPFSMLLGPAIISVLCIAFGLFSFQIFSLIGYSYLIPNMLEIGIMLTAVYLFAFLAMRFANNHVRVSETWGCGILSQNPRMEYTASGFSEPVVTVFKSVYRTEKSSERTYFDNKNSIFKEGRAEIHLLKFFEERVYMPIIRCISKASQFVSEINRGDLDYLMRNSFAAIFALLLIMSWFI